MLVRLWWKEARLFWPIWVFLGVVALGAQWAVLHYAGADARTGVLGLMAMGWATLYGCAAGAAAIAGERENRTLLFLDAQGLDRRLLWGGKASFAVASALALGAVLFAMAALATDRWDTRPFGLVLYVVACVAVVLEVVGWGLLWSAATGNPLTAAILTVCSLILVPLVSSSLAPGMGNLVIAAPIRLAVAVATGLASLAVVVATRPGRGRRRVAAFASPVPLVAARPSVRRPVPAWRPALRALVWQSAREAWPVWWALAVVFLGGTLLVGLLDDPRNMTGFGLVLAWPVGVIAGVSVFGAENRARTQRFLAHHGARPGLVWAARTGVWALGLVALWVPLALAAAVVERPSPIIQRYPIALPAIAMAVGASVGQLCGMAIRRGITAAVVTAAVLLVSTFPVVFMVRQELLSPWAFPALPLACLAISWAWSADWMYERPGPGRWVRLGLLFAGTCGAFFGGYVAYRVGSVPSVAGTILEGFAAPLPPTTETGTGNAAGTYAEASRRMKGEPGDLKDNEEALALIRRAAAMPDCRFPGADRMMLFDRPEVPQFPRMATLLEESAHRRRIRGDLSGSWGDIESLFGMARHMAVAVPNLHAGYALTAERRALGLAMARAADGRQAPDRLRAALDAYRALPRMPAVPEIIRAEAAVTDRTYRLPARDLADRLAGTITESNPSPWVHLWADMATTPWEVARARSAARLLYAAAASQAALGAWERPRPLPIDEGWATVLQALGPQPGGVVTGGELAWVLRSTPLVRLTLPNPAALVSGNDHNEVARRALVQILALRHWQLRHDGRLPSTLEGLVRPPEALAHIRDGGELDVLPADPYSNVPFHYVPSEGQFLLPLGVLDPPGGEAFGRLLRPTVGARLLYSVGADRADDHATRNETSETGGGDIIFTLQDKPGAVPAPPAAGMPDGPDAISGAAPP